MNGIYGRDGWKCPVCGRGVSPDQKECTHGEVALPLPWVPTPAPIPFYPGYIPVPTSGPCSACRNGGVCNCVLMPTFTNCAAGAT